MEQQVLSVEHDGNTIVSKPFDFEAACLVDDSRSEGVLRRGAKAVSYLFEGTAVTDKVIASLSIQKRIALSAKVCKWYQEEMAAALKNG